MSNLDREPSGIKPGVTMWREDAGFKYFVSWAEARGGKGYSLTYTKENKVTGETSPDSNKPNEVVSLQSLTSMLQGLMGR